MRHVPFATSLTTRAAPFAAAAQPALRETWNEYWTCKADSDSAAVEFAPYPLRGLELRSAATNCGARPPIAS